MSSCSKSHSHENAPSAALPEITVNGVSITESDLANELQYHQNPNFELVVQQAGQALVVKELLMARAKVLNLFSETDPEELVLQKLIASEVTTENPTEQDCVRYFENNPERFTSDPLIEADHILLAAAKDDIPGREVAKRKSHEIISQLKLDPLLFPVLAKEFSACPSKETGGSLGQLSKGQTVPEFEKQINRLPTGIADKPIESRYGCHVVNITRKIEGKALEYDMVSDKVKGYLTHRASHLAIQAYIQSLIEAADIQGIKMMFAEENIHI